MSMRNLMIPLLVLTNISAFAQVAKVSVIPASAVVLFDGSVSSSPVKVTTKEADRSVVAYQRGFVTQGITVQELLDENKPEHTLKLNQIKKTGSDFQTKKIEFTKFVDPMGKLQPSNNVPSFIGYVYVDPEEVSVSRNINKRMADWGFNMVGTNAVFQEKIKPEYALGGEILGFGYATKGTPGYKMGVVVEWSLYDINAKKVAFKCKSAGYSDSQKTHSPTEELALALDDASIGLMMNEEFQKIVSGPSSSTEEGNSEVAPTYLIKVEKKKFSGYSDMIKSAVNSAVTIKTAAGHGSGFLVSADGYILTNNHVVDGADKIEAVFQAGMTLEATLIKSDEDRDVALIKIPGSGFTPLPINANKESVTVGSEVIAIGTPEDISLGQSVTKGIISGNRTYEDMSFIQTDVTINRGNSGGPLINNSGEVVGMVVAKIMDTHTEGLGFAIPITEAIEKLNIKFE